MRKIEKVRIKEIEKDSIAEEIGILPGDFLRSINGECVIDILDYKFLMADEYIEVEIEHADGEIEVYEIEKEETDDLGLVFEHELIDRPKNCHNKCIFCFMEQLPKNVRNTLIFKDDDYRLSFFTGNYITMTNMKETDVDRIIRYHLSPIHISIHATDEKTRCMMLNNRFAGKVLGYLKKLYEAGIHMDTQIVLCKGINDGAILEKTIHDLSQYAPVLQSICIVPVGLSKNREGLYPLEKLTAQDCLDTIAIIERYQEKFKKKYHQPIVYLADEFYMKANHSFPCYSDYRGFGQLEDGIGMVPLFDHDFEKARKALKENILNGSIIVPQHRKVTMITGKITKNYIQKKAKQIMRLLPQLEISVIAVENDYFGKDITVTGLVVGRDILYTIQLKQHNPTFSLGDYVIIPEVMLKEDEDIFLDDTKLDTLQASLSVPIVVSEGSADGFIQAIVGKIPKQKIYHFPSESKRQSYENSIQH